MLVVYGGLEKLYVIMYPYVTHTYMYKLPETVSHNEGNRMGECRRSEEITDLRIQSTENFHVT